MPVRFKIEKILPYHGHGQYLLVRCLAESKDFSLVNKSFLNGVELTTHLDIPRKVDENGALETDLFVFKLKNEDDVTKLQENIIAELTPGDTLHCLSPWYFVERGLNAQLAQEIRQNYEHVLYGKQVNTIARREDNDDVLFEVLDSDFKYAKVHLTWRQSSEKDPLFPLTEAYNNWHEVYEQVMVRDSEGWDRYFPNGL